MQSIVCCEDVHKQNHQTQQRTIGNKTDPRGKSSLLYKASPCYWMWLDLRLGARMETGLASYQLLSISPS